ncbi:MAG: GFA family protein [Leptolyngbyaceae cyanobacterium MO_188.B28]|nr:GFA family protein [Leptolyngbyaceae cyanobacterium MO_188.B28]
MLRGSCYCGDIRYKVKGAPFHQTNCHCSICRRTTGAPYVTWFSVSRADFRFTAGQPNRFRSTQKGIRSFCPRCGTQLTFEHEDQDEIDITTCSLEDPERVPPEDHIHTGSKPSWVALSDGLPCHRESRSED